jgi:hypothetical protein
MRIKRDNCYNKTKRNTNRWPVLVLEGTVPAFSPSVTTWHKIGSVCELSKKQKKRVDVFLELINSKLWTLSKL